MPAHLAPSVPRGTTSSAGAIPRPDVMFHVEHPRAPIAADDLTRWLTGPMFHVEHPASARVSDGLLWRQDVEQTVQLGVIVELDRDTAPLALPQLEGDPRS